MQRKFVIYTLNIILIIKPFIPFYIESINYSNRSELETVCAVHLPNDDYARYTIIAVAAFISQLL